LKVAKIRPVYKRGNNKQVTIDLFRFYQFLKNPEKIVYNRLVSFTSKFKILTENQYGFQKNKSIELNWCVWCDKKKCSDICGGLIGHEWCIYCESEKSSDEYLSMLEGRTEELNCET
jgi:hypothetical protein